MGIFIYYQICFKKGKFLIIICFILITKQKKYVLRWYRRKQRLNTQAQQAIKTQPDVYLGRHILAEFFDCDPNILNNVKLIEELMVNAALECGATIVQKCFHMFNPHGVSGVVIIQESHLAIHTWPELGYAAVDLFTCGESCDPKIAYDYLKKTFHSNSANYSELKRGVLDAQQAEVLQMPFQVCSQV